MWLLVGLARAATLSLGFHVINISDMVAFDLNPQHSAFVIPRAPSVHLTVDGTNFQVASDAFAVHGTSLTLLAMNKSQPTSEIWVVPSNLCSNFSVLAFPQLAHASIEFHSSQPSRCIFIHNDRSDMIANVTVTPDDQAFIAKLYTNSSITEETPWATTSEGPLRNVIPNEPFFLSVDHSIPDASFDLDVTRSLSSNPCVFHSATFFNSSGSFESATGSEHVVNCDPETPANNIALIAFGVAAGVVLILVIFVVVRCCRRCNRLKRGEVIEIKQNLNSLDVSPYTSVQTDRSGVIFFERSTNVT